MAPRCQITAAPSSTCSALDQAPGTAALSTDEGNMWTIGILCIVLSLRTYIYALN